MGQHLFPDKFAVEILGGNCGVLTWAFDMGSSTSSSGPTSTFVPQVGPPWVDGRMLSTNCHSLARHPSQPDIVRQQAPIHFEQSVTPATALSCLLSMHRPHGGLGAPSAPGEQCLDLEAWPATHRTPQD